MPTTAECLCCGEDVKSQAKLQGYPGSECITQVPDLHGAILVPITLDIAYYHYRQEHRERGWDANTFNQPGNRY